MKQLLQLSIFSLFFITSFCEAANIKGYLSDSKSGEPLIGATVLLSNTAYGTSSGLDGGYEIKNVPAGKYVIVINYLGYKTTQTEITIGTENLKLNFSLAENSKDLDEVVVTAASNDKESDNVMRKAEQKADNVLNIIGARAIELLPDVTVGNVLQRVSGVSITRNGSGDGQYAIIRGMDKRYSYTLVNGIKIPSPDNKNRYVPLDIFPADLLERLEVIKALTPNMEGDAVGGVMNMVLKSAPATLKISATAAGGYSDIFKSDRPFSGFSTKGIPLKSPEVLYGPIYAAKPEDFSVKQLEYKDKNLPINSLVNFSVGNTILNNKLGFIVAGSYQNIYRGSNTLFYVPGEPSPNPNPNTYQFQELQIREYSTLQKRLGTLAKLDYSFNKNNKISLSNFYVQLSEAQHRNYRNPLGNGVGTATLDIHDRSRYTIQKIFNSSLRGDHLIFNNKIKLDWTLVYSLATSNTPAWSDMNVRYRYDNKVLQSIILLPVDQRWNNNRDEDQTAYLNLIHSPSQNLEFSIGGMARFKKRKNVNSLYTLGTNVTDVSQQYQAFTTIDKAVFNFGSAESQNTTNIQDPNNYDVLENVSGFYAQGKYSLNNRLQILGGLRIENTYIEWHSKLDIRKRGANGKVPYSNFLPSINLKYALSDNQNLRLSYYSAICRPNYFDYVPTELQGDFFTESGNPDLKAAKSDNYDFRYEFFGNGNAQILAGVFYKKINDAIELGFKPDTIGGSNNNIIPFNFGLATNYGFELVVTKYINNWGITGNYTFTNSSITTTKASIENVPDPSNPSKTKTIRTKVDQSRPLQGQSNHIANVSLIYKNPKIGLDAQLSWVYTGRRINLVGFYKDLDYWQRGFSQVDFSAEKSISKSLKIFSKITNILNASLITEVLNNNFLDAGSPGQDKSDRIVVQKDVFNQTFLAGFKYKF